MEKEIENVSLLLDEGMDRLGGVYVPVLAEKNLTRT
jgi:hypothetical protein